MQTTTGRTYEEECASLAAAIRHGEDMDRLCRTIERDPCHAAVLAREGITAAEYLAEWIPTKVLFTRKSVSQLSAAQKEVGI